MSLHFGSASVVLTSAFMIPSWLFFFTAERVLAAERLYYLYLLECAATYRLPLDGQQSAGRRARKVTGVSSTRHATDTDSSVS